MNTIEPIKTYKIRLLAKKIIYKFRFLKISISDYKRFKKNSFAMSFKYDVVKLEAKLTLHYHSIEKGLTNREFRYGFGKRAITELTYSLDLYIKNGFPLNNQRVISSIRVLENYVNVHKENSSNVNIDFVEKKLRYYKNMLLDNNVSYVYKSQTIYHLNNKEKFKSLKENTNRRRSVREYKEEIVQRNIVDEIISEAQYTPSVCNRQPWKVIYITDKNKIIEILKLQNGMNMSRINKVNNLFVIGVDLRYFANGFERHEPYIAGGMYTMNILNQIHTKNLGACALNSSMSKKTATRIRAILKLHKSIDITNFVTFGYKLDNYKTPASDRDSISKIFTVIE